MTDPFAGTRALVTGGLGFIGSSLARALHARGAQVTVCDARIEGQGANPFNLEGIGPGVDVRAVDVRDQDALCKLVAGCRWIFHCASQTCHVKSFEDPRPDVDLTIGGTTSLAEACRHASPDAVLVRTGTRGQYGKPRTLPVSEEAPSEPRGIYEIAHLSAELILLAYRHNHGLKVVLPRLTNVYGPRAQMRHSGYGVVNWFVRLALEGRPIPVFGDGRILRDFLYVDDCVEALLCLAACPQAVGEVVNVGHDAASDFRTVAELLCRMVEGARWEPAPFTPERQAQEPGDFYTDWSKLHKLTGWEPSTPLEPGLRRTVEYYRRHRARYWP